MIYVIGSDMGQPRRLTNPNGSDTRPSWSRDGKWIYFSSNRGGSVGIWKVAWSNPENAVQVTTDGGTTALESSDGKELFYRNASGIWSVPVKGGQAKKIIPQPAYGQWAVAARSIYFLRRDGPLSIWVLRLDTGRQFEYVRFPAGLGASPNGSG